jgi:L-threonylcarbamoyladenylate synthase
MDTEVLGHDAAAIARAVALLAAGQPVAFPTETVYGLGARADDAAAVARVYAVKGRPSDKPLIVHVADVAGARRVSGVWDETAEALARAFWPGPLTLVLPLASAVCEAVTAGTGTVAVRAPAHPLALALLRACPFPVAAPSANRSGAPPSTSAAEVLAGLGGRIPLILDGGPTHAPVPSTILDLTLGGGRARLVRKGALPLGELAAWVRIVAE